MLQLMTDGKPSEIEILKKMTVRDFYAFYEAHLVYVKRKNPTNE